MNLSLDRKVVLVAASSKGLGLGIAQALAAEGACVALGSRTVNAVEEAACVLRERYGGDAKGYALDVTDAHSIQEWIRSAAKDFGRIDGLVVNAGGPPPGTFDSFGDEDWEAAFNLTLMSAVRMIRGALPEMRRAGGGSIVTVTSSTIKEPLDNMILSNVLRSGVVSLVKTLSNQLAAERIRVNNLVPGRIDTDRVRALDVGAADRSHSSLEAEIARKTAAIPLGRYGTIEEFGAAAAFLLSERASYVTGATLMVDGGQSRTVW